MAMNLAAAAASRSGGSSGHHAALPGAILTGLGLFLIVWALEGFGLIGNRDTGVTTFADPKGNRPVPKGTTTSGGKGPATS